MPSKKPTNSDSHTRHGDWTPDVAREADREVKELAGELPETDSPSVGVDKTKVPEPHTRRDHTD